MKLFLGILLGVASFGSASAMKISTTYERMTIRSFDGFGLTCKDAQQHAMLGCNAWMAEFADSHEMTESSYCRALECGCTVTPEGPIAKCFGTARYLSTITSGEVDGKIVGEKRGCPLKTDPIVRAVGTGLDCWEADYEAKLEVFSKLEQLSDDVDIIDLRPVVCNCRHGYPSYAVCNTTAHALWQKSVPWDAPPCH